MLSHWPRYVAPIFVAAFVSSCAATLEAPVVNARYAPGTGPSEQLQLPAPFATPSARNNSKVIGWPKGKAPTAAPGFAVSLYADNLANPRQTYILPNGDVLVVESIREWIGRPDRPEKSANRITLFRDTNGDGKPDLRETFITGLNMPHGMALVGNWFYIGNTDGVVRYPYRGVASGVGSSVVASRRGAYRTRITSGSLPSTLKESAVKNCDTRFVTTCLSCCRATGSKRLRSSGLMRWTLPIDWIVCYISYIETRLSR